MSLRRPIAKGGELKPLCTRLDIHIRNTFPLNKDMTIAIDEVEKIIFRDFARRVGPCQ